MRTILESPCSPADRMTAPLSIVLRQNDKGEFVTHMANHEDGGFHSGHYFHADEFVKAVLDWEKRCADINVAPEPMDYSGEIKEQIQEDILTRMDCVEGIEELEKLRNDLCQIICDRLK